MHYLLKLQDLANRCRIFWYIDKFVIKALVHIHENFHDVSVCHLYNTKSFHKTKYTMHAKQFIPR